MRLVKRVCFCVALSASLGLAACGGGDDTNGDGDGDGDGDQINPDGTHNQYVVDTVTVPGDQDQALMLGRDFNDDDQPDNALGGLMATLQSDLVGLDLQTTVDEAVNMGGIILLANVQATSLDDATGVGTWMFFGENPDPAPPGHLAGEASFDVTSDSPLDAVLVGSISDGQLLVGPGDVSIQISLGDAASPITLDLKSAQIEAGITASALNGGKLTGAVTQDDIDNEVLPAVHETVSGIVERDCTGVPAGEDACGCGDSTGAAVLGFLDADDDCEVTLVEIRENSLISTAFQPDLDLDGDSTPESLSIGLGFSAIGAVYDLPSGI